MLMRLIDSCWVRDDFFFEDRGDVREPPQILDFPTSKKKVRKSEKFDAHSFKTQGWIDAINFRWLGWVQTIWHRRYVAFRETDMSQLWRRCVDVVNLWVVSFSSILNTEPKWEFSTSEISSRSVTVDPLDVRMAVIPVLTDCLFLTYAYCYSICEEVVAIRCWGDFLS